MPVGRKESQFGSEAFSVDCSWDVFCQTNRTSSQNNLTSDTVAPCFRTVVLGKVADPELIRGGIQESLRYFIQVRCGVIMVGFARHSLLMHKILNEGSTMQTHQRATTSILVPLVLFFGFHAQSFGQHYGQVTAADTVFQDGTFHSIPLAHVNAIPNANEFANGHVMDSGFMSSNPTVLPIIAPAETYPVTVPAPMVDPLMVAHPINVDSYVVGQQIPVSVGQEYPVGAAQEFPIVSDEPGVAQRPSTPEIQYINGVPTIFSSDVDYAGPGDMRTHLWNDHKQEMEAYGFTRAQVESMSLQTAQKWHNFFHGSEGLPSETQ